MARVTLITGGVLISLLSLTSLAPAVADEAAAKQHLALQMYTLRNVGTLEQQFALAQQSGFSAVELVGNHGVSAAQMQALLKKYQLRAIADHVQLAELRSNSREVVAFNKAVGNPLLVMPWLKPEERPTTAEGWKKLAHELDALGGQLRQQGMTLAYHNHDFEMKKYDGKTALEILLDNSKPSNLQLEMDAAWVSRGGQDPVRLLSKYAGRVVAIHAKDNAGIGIRDDEMNFAPAGSGLLAWNEVLPAAVKANTRWFIVEHDLPKDPQGIIVQANSYLVSQLKTLEK
ncbi:TIM barrel protein [Erwinia sp. E602]|uniref:sugar phosphate isomerase/epimerase family protein n=1 Tax=Erwinia sp. E602 TaxID=2675378 RepID=UPI001BA95854|nr:sugar phosphate isomerase/epimerase [Erwinia sp. E602]QUG75655.1 TIM barrel protein [Erwinia sp. E602]